MSDLESVMLSYVTMICGSDREEKFKLRRLSEIAPFITSPEASKIYAHILEYYGLS
jgi:hypothetical protein